MLTSARASMLGAAVVVAVVGGCAPGVPCRSSAECPTGGTCDSTFKICFTHVDAGPAFNEGSADAGRDAGPTTPCGDQGCPAWKACMPTGPATGVCTSLDIKPVAPQEDQAIAGTARTVFKFQVTQWDGGVLERESIPVLAVDGGIVGPATLSRVGNAFQAEFVPANVLGRQSVTAGWPAVNATISVNTKMCSVSCAEWQECLPTQDGGTCANLDVQLSVIQPVDLTVGRNASVPIQARVWRINGGALPASVPFRTTNGIKGVLEGSIFFSAVIDGGSAPGDIAITLGWEDGGTIASGKYTVDLTPPLLTVTPSPPAGYPGGAGDFFPNDSTPAWRKDETIDVTVTSSSVDIDPSSVVVTAQHVSETALTIIETPADCGGTYCKVFRVDLSQVQMNAFADDVTLYATASDVRGNAMPMPASGAVRVTRWQWARQVAAPAALTASPAIGANGTIYLGLAGTSQDGLVAVRSTGVVEPSSDDGRVDGSPTIGRNDAGMEYVFYQPSTAAGTLKALGVAQSCTGVGLATDASKATPTVLYDGTNDVMAVSLQGSSTGSRVVGLKPATSDCPHSTTDGLAPITSNPGNLVSTGDDIFWGDSSGELHLATFANLTFALSPDHQTPGGVGIMNGIVLFNLGIGNGIGGGGPGIGKIFAYETSLTQNSPWMPDYDPTPTSGPIVVSQGVVAAIRNGSKVQVLRVNATDGKKAALTAAFDGTRFASTEVPTPVAGEGGLLYVIDDTGSLVVLPQSFPQVGGTASWTAPAAITGPTSASPTIDCNRRRPSTHTGILYFVTENGWLVSYIVDSKGLDSTAPWPKYAHDVRNTGNPSVAIEPCP